jgi:iron complex transport system substrate-binding protein
MLQKQKISSLLLLTFITALFSCKNESKNSQSINPQITPNIEYHNLKKDIEFKYAKGLTIKGFYDKYVISIKNPWKNSQNNLVYELLDSTSAYFDESSKHLEGVFYIPKKIVVTSTTHIPALELIGVENRLVGFPGTKYISSEKTRKRIDNGFVRELGKNESINTEVLLEIKPDIVIGFGVDGANKSFENIKKANIPVIYNGDWLEDSPLAKAEWIKFFGVLFNKEKEADSIFNTIESEYLKAKELASKTTKRPTILSGAMHKDIWYLPNGNSTEAQFLKDANVHYIWQETSGTGSLALNFESVFTQAKNADIWLSPSNYPSLNALEKANPHYTRFDAFKTKQVYSFNNTTGNTGGVLYYELGIARPDLVLKDIIKICHPELLKDYQPYFFKPLE